MVRFPVVAGNDVVVAVCYPKASGDHLFVAPLALLADGIGAAMEIYMSSRWGTFGFAMEFASAPLNDCCGRSPIRNGNACAKTNAARGQIVVKLLAL